MKQILFLFCCIFFIEKASSQDSVLLKKNMQQMQVGVYYTPQSFFSKKADDTRPFKVVANYYIRFAPDTIFYGYTGEYADSSKFQKKAFAFYDGNKMYLRQEKKGFFPFDGFGRHPYLLKKENFFSTDMIMFMPMVGALLLPFAAGTMMLNRAANYSDDKFLYYYNKNHKLIKATPVTIAWLLKSDKDLYKQFEKEDKVTTAVMIKYLDKLNERYPGL